jgi:hypothetical protein
VAANYLGSQAGAEAVAAAAGRLGTEAVALRGDVAREDTNAIADPGRVPQMWSKDFAAMHGKNGCFVLTCHPFVSGRASRIALLEDLVRFMRGARGGWFATCEEVARWHASRPEMAGTTRPRRAAPAPRRRRVSR